MVSTVGGTTDFRNLSNYDPTTKNIKPSIGTLVPPRLNSRMIETLRQKLNIFLPQKQKSQPIPIGGDFMGRAAVDNQKKLSIPNIHVPKWIGPDLSEHAQQLSNELLSVSISESIDTRGVNAPAPSPVSSLNSQVSDRGSSGIWEDSDDEEQRQDAVQSLGHSTPFFGPESPERIRAFRAF